VTWAYDESRRILRENRDKLELVAQRLLEVETLDSEEFLALMGETATASTNEPRIPPSVNTRTPTPGVQTPSDEGTERPSLGTAPSPA
jgi:cell division protease FtsH